MNINVLKQTIDIQMQGLADLLNEDNKLNDRELEAYLKLEKKTHQNQLSINSLMKLERNILTFCTMLLRRRCV